MTAMLRTARRLLDDDSGATAIEYALLAAMIAMVIIALGDHPRADARRDVLERQRRAGDAHGISAFTPAPAP